MNRIYRLVFNRALGVLQVASELATSAGGSSGKGAGQLTGTLRAVSFALWVAMGWVGLVIPGVAQQASTTASAPSAGATGRIVSDPSAPRTQRPTVIAAPNGTPVVNITTPSAAGVSRNTYSQFDVGTQGAILNNARTSTQTQLGGWVQGNPWLATGTARVILNEVNSAHPSYLNGYIEVAGDRAEVIIANPAGIQVDGGGFLNASRATLTTGTPVFAGGSLDHYRVTGGVIGISGAGLDASRTDYTHLIARSLRINAGLWAQHLSVTAGTNTVEAASGAVQANASSGAAPALAVDVGQLGGMYAGKIVLVGTEHGVGVRNAGEIGAQAGDLVVTVDGRLENTGSLQAQQDGRVLATQGIANAGMLSAGRELSVTTAADIDNTGGTLNAMRVELDAQALRNRDGSIEQTGIQALALNAGMMSNRDGGRIGDVGDLPGEGGHTPGGEDPPDGSGDDGGTGQPGDGGEIVQPPAPPVVPLADGALNIAGLLDNDGGRIVAGGGVDLATSQGLDNDGGQLGLRALTVSQGDVSNRAGTLTVLGPARFDVGVFDNDAGTFNANQALMLSAQWLSNRGGVLNHAGTDATRIRVTHALDNTDGTLASNASALNIGSGQLINARGVIQQSGTQGLTLSTGRLDGNGGTIATAGALTVSATDIAHRDATLSASQVTLTASGLDNTGGQIVATGTAANMLTVTGTLDNTAGVLASNGDLFLAASILTNADGVVQQAGTGTLAIAAETLNGQGGTLVSNGALTISGQSTDLREGTTSAQRIAIDTGDLTTSGGQLTATGTDVLSLQVRNTLDNTGGTMGTNGALDIAAHSLNNRQGIIVAAGTSPSSVAVGTRLDNTGGTLSFNGDATLDAGELLNAGGTVLAAEASALQVTVDGLLDNSAGGRLAAGGDLTLEAATLDNRSGRIEQAGEGDLDIQADTLLGEGGRISSQGMLELTGEDIDLRGGTTVARDIAVTAGTLTTADGMLASTGDGALRVQVREDLNNDRGTIAANGALDLDAGALSNREGVLTSAGTDNTRIAVRDVLDNTDGTLASNASALNIGSGQLINARGVIQQSGTQGLTLSTGRLDGNGGTIATAGALTVSATDIAHRDATLSASQVTLTASGLDNTGGQIVATGTAANMLTVTGTLDNTAGVLASNGDLFLAASILTNADGVVQQAGTGTLAIAAETLNGQGGTLVSNGALTISGQSTDLREGTTSAQRIAIDTGDLTTSGGQLTATGTDVLSLQVRNTLDNTGGTMGGNGTVDLAASTFVNADGVLQTAGAGQNRMHVAGELDNRGGTLLAAGDARVQAGVLANVAGTLQVAGALQLEVEGRLDNSAQGIIASGSDMQVVAGEVDNQTGVLGAGGTLDIASATGIDNTAGTVQAGGALTLASDGLVNRDGTVIGAQVRVDARGQAFDNTSGTLASTAGGVTVSSGALDNTAGLLQSAGDLAIDTAGQTLTNAQSGSAGGIVSAGRLDIRSGDLANEAGVVFAQGDATLAVGAIDNTSAGSLGSAAHLTIQGASLSNTGGTVQAGGNASLTLSGELDNQAGLIAADETLTAAAATIDNRDTRSDANPALGLQAGRVRLDAGSLDNRQGQVIADAEGRIAVAGALNNGGGLVSTGGTLDIGADAIVNTAGTFISGDNQTLTARTLSGDGQVLSQGDATLVLQGDFVNTGEVTANGMLSLITTGDLLNAGTLQAGQLDLRAVDIDNAVAGEMSALGVVRLEAQGTLVNRGLIDGAVTHVQAGVVDNLGTGRLHGDHVAIEAGEVRNRAETVDGTTRSATIAARLQLDLGVGTLDNTGGGLIYSGGHAAIGGALDGDLLATGTAGTVNNVSSIIDVEGALSIDTGALNNIRENVVITPEGVQSVDETATLHLASWQLNGANTSSTLNTTNNYRAFQVYYVNPADILEDGPYITPDGYRIGRAVVRLTPETSSYFFAHGGLDGARGERWRVNPADGTVTIYYTIRQDGQSNPDQGGSDDPFQELTAGVTGRPFQYQTDNLSYSSAYGSCADDCVQLITPWQYTDPDGTIIHRFNDPNSAARNEEQRIAHHTAFDDVVAPGMGADAVIRSGEGMYLTVDDLTNRYGRIAAGGDLVILGHGGASRVVNIGQTLYRTHYFNNTSIAYNGTTRAWSNLPVSEQIGQVGGSITSGGTLVIDVGDLSNLDEGRDAPNVQDGAALANLNTDGPGTGPVGPGDTSVDGPAQVGGTAAGNATASGPGAVTRSSTTDAVLQALEGVDGHQAGRATMTLPATVAAPSDGPAGTVGGTDAVAGSAASGATGSAPGTVGVAALDLQLPTSSLFTVQPNGGQYLVETDPRFADYRNWLGSDYLLNALGYSPTNLHKRLGDGYYEQKLIRDQIGQLTGRRFLTGYSNEEDQFRALMEAGAVFARQFGLRPGVALSAEQMAQLTSDIVWLVEQTVTLADGSTATVLVPQVYLRLRPGDISQNGALLAGENVHLNLRGDLVNSGDIAGRQVVSINATNLHNIQGGAISGRAVGLQATQDINIIGATVTAQDVLSVRAGGDVTVASTTQIHSEHGDSTSYVNRVAGLYVTNPGGLGVLSVDAGGDITLQAAQIHNAGLNGLAQLAAVGNVNLTTLTTGRSTDTTWNARNYRRSASTAEVGTTISGAGDVQLIAGQDINARAAQINAGDSVQLAAGRDISITEGRATTDISNATYKKSSGFLSKRSHSEQVTQSTDTGIGSNISAGGGVDIAAGRDYLQRGSNVLGNDNVSIAAGNNVTIESSQDTFHQDIQVASKKSGFSGGIKDGVASVGYGSAGSKSRSTIDATTQVASGVGSLSGNVTIKAGDQLTLAGSDVAAGNNLTLIGKDVKLEARQDTYEEHTTRSSKQSGFSVGATVNPLAAYKAGRDSANAQGGNYSDSTIGKLAQRGEGTSEGAHAATQGVVVQAGSSRSNGQSDYASSTARTTQLSAGNNLTILATEGSITSQGTQMSAEGDALLLAKQHIDLDVAHNTESQSDTSTRSGWQVATNRRMPVGVHNQNADGNGVTDTITGTQISAGGDVTLATQEGDITLTAAQVVAENDVNIAAARNLTIQSGQDTASNANRRDDKAIGSVVISDTERFVGYHAEKDNSRNASVTQVASNVGSLSGNVNLTAGETYTQTASNVVAANDVNITAKQIELLTANDINSEHQDSRDTKIGVFGRVYSPIIDLVNNAEAARTSDGRLATMQGMAAAANAYQAASAISSMAGGPGGGALLGAEAGIGFAQGKSEYDAASSTAVGSNISGGRNVTLTSTEGDIHAVQASIKAGDTLTLDSADDILLEAGRSQYSSEGASSNVGAEVGVGVSVGAQTGVYAYAQVSAGSSRSQSDATYYGNTHLAGDTITLRSQGDTTLRGADARANTINAEVGGALTIESVQDTVTESSKDSGFDARVQVSFGTAWSASANASSAQAGGSYAAVNQQSGLFAGDGGYHVNADSVNLVGGAITSTNAASSDLTANSLTFEHLQNQMDYQASSASIGGGVSGGSGSGSQNSVGQQSADIQNVLNGSTSLGRANGASIGGGVPMQESGSDSSTTYATLTEGNITVGGQRTTTAELGVHTDAATAHTAIKELPDLQQVLADQQAMSAAAGNVLATSRQVADDLANAARTRADAIGDAVYNGLSDAERQAYASLTSSEQDLFLSSRSSEFAAANNAANAWGTGGAYSRALGAVSTALVSSVAGQGDVQVLTNALAPYAAQLIGERFDSNHGSDPSQMAQALSHALLGALLAEVNGANAAGGALAGAGGELAAQVLTQALYGSANPDDLREDQRQTISALSSLVGALAGGIVGGDSGTVFNAAVGGNVATNAVENNRLLVATEIARIRDIAGGDPQVEAELIAAACALIKCSAGFTPGTPEHAYWAAIESEGNKPEYANDRDLLANQVYTTTRGYMNHSWDDTVALFSYGSNHALDDWWSRTQAGTRLLGGLQAVGGAAEAAGGLLIAPSCTTGIGCVGAGFLVFNGADNAASGWQTAWSGKPTSTLGGEALQLAGFSPEAAELLYGMTSLTPSAADALLLSRAVDAEIDFNLLARASYADFVPSGLQAMNEVMSTPQAQALIREIQAGSPGISDDLARMYAAEYIQSGSTLPNFGKALPGSVLIKVVPKGDKVSTHTGFWMTPQQARAIAMMTPEQAGKVLGLPAAQAARMQSGGMDFYAITAKPGATPSIFTSEVAATSQGGVTMPGGAQQVIVPNRRQWTTASQVNPFTLRPPGGG